MKILRGLPETSEWSQINLLKIILQYDTDEIDEIENILDSMLSRLSHINPAIVFYSSNVIIKFAKKLTDQTLYRGVLRKLSSPLGSLMSSSNEMVYLLLRNFQIISEEYSIIFEDPKVFFLNFNEPMYIKTEKVKLLSTLCNSSNHKLIITEIYEYCNDPSPEFSRLSIEILWRIALRLEIALPSILKIFTKVLKDSQNNSFVNHLLNEICYGLHFLVRKYKNKFDVKDQIGIILKSWDRLVDKNSKTSYLYFFNKFGLSQKDEIVNQITECCQDFENEDEEVQLMTLSLVMKFYLDFPSQLDSLAKRIFKYCTEINHNPDLRDKAFIYWRLITINKSVAKKLFMINNQSINISDKFSIPKHKMQLLLRHLGSFSATFHDCETLISNETSSKIQYEETQPVPDVANNDNNEIDLLEIDFSNEKTQPNISNSNQPDDLLAMNVNLTSTQNNVSEVKPTTNAYDDMFDFMDNKAVNTNPPQPSTVPVEQPVSNNYGNFDLLDDLQEVKAQVPVQSPQPTDPIEEISSVPIQDPNPIGNFDDLDFMSPSPQTQTVTATSTANTPHDLIDPPVIPPENKYDGLDMLDFEENVQNVPEVNPQNELNLDYLNPSNEQPKTENNDKSYNDDRNEDLENESEDEIWLNENQMNNQGKNGIRVSGRWEEYSDTECNLVFTISNCSNEEFKSPRFDINKNIYGFLFAKTGLGVSLDSIPSNQKRSFKHKIIFNGIGNKLDESNHNSGDLNITLGSGFDEFEFLINVPIQYLLFNEPISEDEYRETWRGVPKEDHIQFDLKLPYSKIIEGNWLIFRGSIDIFYRILKNIPFQEC